MLSTALNLSPQILSLGDSLITKITGFTEEEDNFGICHDFLVSNLLYHTYLEPHESDALRKFEKLIDKWKIQNKGEKAARVEELLENFRSSQVFSEGVEHDQHGIKTRLLVLLLSLTNSDEIKVKNESEIEATDEDIQKLLNSIVQESEASKAARKAKEIRALLAQGEEPCRHFSGKITHRVEILKIDFHQFLKKKFREIKVVTTAHSVEKYCKMRSPFLR